MTTPCLGANTRSAAPQGGYVSSTQAREAGYSPELVQYHVRKGRLERAGRGALRLAHFPGDTDDLVPIWLWSGRAGVFSHETAWTGPVYARMALDDGLPWPDIDALSRAVKVFLDTVLGGGSGTWDPSWRWRA
jgi:hypothetical protein